MRIHVSMLMQAQVWSVFFHHVCLSVHMWMHGNSLVFVCACAVCGRGCGHAPWKRVDVDIIYSTGNKEPAELRGEGSSAGGQRGP